MAVAFCADYLVCVMIPFEVPVPPKDTCMVRAASNWMIAADAKEI